MPPGIGYGKSARSKKKKSLFPALTPKKKTITKKTKVTLKPKKRSKSLKAFESLVKKKGGHTFGSRNR